LVANSTANPINGSIKIGTSLYPSGLYICTISRNNFPNRSVKFVVQH
jgi:hypothetical protein